ncbi:hypothetical protein Goklo_017498, partial [Gossypium klotzschianum]|nr:hypothetical protein [Gossypium klotzschianum]
ALKPNILAVQLQITILCRIRYYLKCKDGSVDLIPTWSVRLDGDDLAITFGPSLGCYKDARTIADIDGEIDAKNVATIKNLEERNNYHGCEDDISLDKMDVSTKQS